MQELYYTPASSSLLLVRDDNTNATWNNISSLIVCSSLYEIVAFSGSSQIVAFPIDNTNLYYAPFINTSSAPPPSQPSSPTITTLESFITWAVVLTQNTLSNGFMTGSAGYIYSGSTYYVSQSSISNNGGFTLNTGSSYTLFISGANTSATYDTYLALYDTTTGSQIPGIPGDIIYNLSGSSAPLSASFIPSASHTYEAVLALIGKS
jgi:hypothetical protein